jgi:hypothetical protein
MLRCLLRYHLLVAPLLVLASTHFLRGKEGAFVAVKSKYIRNLTMTSKFLAADFAPDGNLSKKVWQDAPRVSFDQDRFGLIHFPDSENDPGWDSHFDHATKIDAQHKLWTVEMRIPVKSMNLNAIRPGDEWRLNLYRADGPGDDTQRRFMCWSPLPAGPNKSFHQPASFGIIKFAELE